MARDSAAKERLEARLTREQKELFVRAAEMRGLSLTDFILTTVQEVAERTIQATLTIELSRRDQALLVQALNDPPAPSARLRKAAADYNKRHAIAPARKARR